MLYLYRFSVKNKGNAIIMVVLMDEMYSTCCETIQSFDDNDYEQS